MRDVSIASKDKLKELVEGRAPWDEVKNLIRLKPKDTDRFLKYIEILQEKVPWDDKILLRISDHLYIVSKGSGKRITKCDCGHEFGDYRVNWKLNSKIRIRNTEEEMAKVISIEEVIPNTDLMEIREFYCPGCFSQLGVEVIPPGYPPVFEFLPDIDTLYRDWLDVPLDDADDEWFQDKSGELIVEWGKEL